MSSLVILVTGVSRGIGKATAKILHQKGHLVYGIARGTQPMGDLEDIGLKVRRVDVTNDDQLKGVISEIIHNHGKIDVLINNAGVSIYGSIEETPQNEAKALFDTNVFAYARAIQLVLPYMREKRSGCIINIGSVAGFVVVPANGWYCASKFAIEALTDSLRMEVSQLGIKVILIEPEVIQTGIGDSALQSLDRYVLLDDYKFLNSKLKTVVSSSIEGGISPEIVAHRILKVLEKRKPRPRYFVPRYSRIILTIKWLLPDRWLDRITFLIFNSRSK